MSFDRFGRACSPPATRHATHSPPLRRLAVVFMCWSARYGRRFVAYTYSRLRRLARCCRRPDLARHEHPRPLAGGRQDARAWAWPADGAPSSASRAHRLLARSSAAARRREHADGGGGANAFGAAGRVIIDKTGLIFLLTEPDQLHIYNPSFHLKLLFLTIGGLCRQLRADAALRRSWSGRRSTTGRGTDRCDFVVRVDRSDRVWAPAQALSARRRVHLRTAACSCNVIYSR